MRLAFVTVLAALSSLAWVSIAATAADIPLGGMVLSGGRWLLAKSQGPFSTLDDGASGRVMVMEPAPYSGSRESAFRAVLRGIVADADWKVKEAMLPQGHEVLFTSEFAEPGGVRTYFVPVAIFSGDQMAVLALVDVGYRGKDALQESFGELLSSVRFGDASATTEIRGPGEALDGFYAAIGAKTGVSVLAQVTIEVGAKGLWLHPDGRFVLTESGVTMDSDAYCAERPKNCGRYRIENGQYRTWRIATTQQQRLRLYSMKTSAFREEGRDLIIGETRYRHLPPVSDLRLEGQYASASADSSTGPSGEQTAAYAETVYAFLSDGRFFKGGYISNFSSGMGVTTGVWGDQTGKTGRYSIDGYTLSLDFDGGERDEKAFFLMDEVPVIDGDMYRKVE